MLRIIDTETCGLQGGIVEIASVDVVDGKIVNPMSHRYALTAPSAHRRWLSIALLKQWWPISRGLKTSSRSITAAKWYVAHNASFDRRVLPDMPGVDLHHEALPSFVAGDQIQQHGAV